jgi:hypothetical protein
MYWKFRLGEEITLTTIIAKKVSIILLSPLSIVRVLLSGSGDVETSVE